MGPISRLMKSIFGKKPTETKKEVKQEVKTEHKTVVPAKVSVTPELAKKVSDPYGFGDAADDIVESGVDIATVSVISVYEAPSFTSSDDSYSRASSCDGGSNYSPSYDSGSSSSDSGSSSPSCD